MAFKHACFISYRSTRQPLAERFLKEFYEGLSAELALLIENEIYLDWSRLQSGEVWSGQIARAICESACMIAVYTPTYFSISHTWSAREYVGMELLEKKRLALLTPGKTIDLIFPVVLRRAHHMPPAIGRRQYSDFSDFLLSDRSLLTNRRYREQLRYIAEWIASVNRQLSELPPSAVDCGSFRLPSEDDIRSYLEEQTIRGEMTMANVYIEARPKGRPEGSAIQDYVVEDHADHELGTFKTQKEAIDWAKANGHAPLVARVRHLNDKKTPDHWRSA